ncbi:MAG TPA: HEAT repeat domain-containing protein [Kofleriaceae bacterium]|jgi:HEAT repeat protein|nr:HEAT repeat domain-containing protein [Kofleriaceae bacterium]
MSRLRSSTPVALVALALACLLACGPSAAAKRAQSLLDRGDYEGAARVADDELVKAPGDAHLQRIRIRAALGLGDAAGAVARYRAWREARGGVEDLAALRTMALTTMWQGLTSPSAQVQVQAIKAIERHEIEDFAHDVAERMGDDDDVVVAAAAIAILRAFPQAPDVATEMLKSHDAQARAIAVEGIGRKVGKPALEDLRFAAVDRDPRVRAVAAAALGAIADPADTGRLTELVTDASAEVRAASIRALARGKRGDLGELATRALADEALGVRLAAVDLLTASRGKAAARALLGHQDPMVAAYAARALGDHAAAAPVLDRALADGDPSVRSGAVNLLGAALGDDGARPRATRAGQDPDPSVRVAAARVLAYLGDKPAAIAVYADVLGGTDEHARIGAAAELAHLGDARGVAALEQLAGSADAGVRRRVVTAHLAARVITPGLWTALADDQAATRIDAAATLYELGAR